MCASNGRILLTSTTETRSSNWCRARATTEAGVRWDPKLKKTILAYAAMYVFVVLLLSAANCPSSGWLLPCWAENLVIGLVFIGVVLLLDLARGTGRGGGV